MYVCTYIYICMVIVGVSEGVTCGSSVSTSALVTIVVTHCCIAVSFEEEEKYDVLCNVCINI